MEVVESLGSTGVGADRIIFPVKYPTLKRKGTSAGGGDMGPRGASGPPGSLGPPGPQGPPGSKYAVVQGDNNPVGLFCMESPSPMFIDVYSVELKEGKGVVDIDPDFLAACEDHSIIVLSHSVDILVLCNATIVGNQISACATQPCNMIVTIAGIRRGSGGVRFPQFSEEQMDKNNQFWDKAVHGV